MQPTAPTRNATLLMALELSKAQWKVGFKVSAAQKPRERTIAAGHLEQLEKEIALAKQQFQVPATAPVLSCYEAGRDGFWIHRALSAMGIKNLVVDSSSIEVNRRRRRAKTDRLDLASLLKLLWRYREGDKKAFSVVRVPSDEAEDKRHLHRELESLKKEQTSHVNRIKGLLAAHGVKKVPVRKDFVERLSRARRWDGTAVPAGLRQRLEREYARLKMVRDQIGQLDKQRHEAVKSSEDPAVAQVRELMNLRALGINSSWLFAMEFFSWRQFRNRREVGGLSGLTPTPFNSGGGDREQGISKDGIARVRSMAIEIAWCWLRFQPQSELSRWFQKRYGSAPKRMRRVGIVALARKLLVALWRYLDQGILPAGAELKA